MQEFYGRLWNWSHPPHKPLESMLSHPVEIGLGGQVTLNLVSFDWSMMVSCGLKEFHLKMLWMELNSFVLSLILFPVYGGKLINSHFPGF